MSEQNKPPAQKGGTKVRVLVDGPYGNANDVVELSGDDLKAAKGAGAVDDDAAAVKYAQSLAKQQD